MIAKSGNTTQLIFVIPPQANMFDFSGAAQVFHEAIGYGLNAQLQFCSFEDTIKTSTNVPLGKVESYKQRTPRAGDFVFLVSADIFFILGGKMKVPTEFLKWVRAAHESGATICGICTGVFILGKTGLLDGRNCTTHWKRTGELQQMFPLAKVQENIIYIEDNGIISSAGATSGIDVALYVLSKLKDDYFTYKISRELVIYNRRSGSNVQQSVFLEYRNHVHAGIHKVQDWLVNNLHKKTVIADLADIAMMSERNFTRVFKKETQLTVNEYMTRLRKEKIYQLSKNPDLSREQIAKQCGLQSVRQLGRLMSA